MISILIVDELALVREALAVCLRHQDDFEVVGYVSNPAHAVDQVTQRHPDIVLMDIEMPGLDSFDATRRIFTISPSTRVIFLSALIHDRFIELAIAAKARGFVAKLDTLDTLIQAIRETAAGGTYFSKLISDRIEITKTGLRAVNKSKSRLAKLTPRELSILCYIAEGNAQKEIAKTLSISVKTVETHCTNLMAKLGIHDRVQLTRYAIREGITHA